MDKILLKGIQFYGYHGVSEVERQVGQRYLVDIEISYDTALAGKEDDLNQTINYSEIFRLVLEIGTCESFRLIEAMAQRIADAILAKFPIQSVLVRVKKIRRPLQGMLEYAGVEIIRKRKQEDGKARHQDTCDSNNLD